MFHKSLLSSSTTLTTFEKFFFVIPLYYADKGFVLFIEGDFLFFVLTEKLKNRSSWTNLIGFEIHGDGLLTR